jgi:hypothetical protein
MIYRQVRIFVPPQAPFDTATWVETLVHLVIEPLINDFLALEWFWFSRYGSDRTESGDCDISKIPVSFAFNGGLYKSLRFRFSVPEDNIAAFEAGLYSLVQQHGCLFSHVLDYDYRADLACPRFLGAVHAEPRITERAQLMARFLCSVCRLFIHTIVGPDAQGHFSLEANSDMTQNPHGATFESVHHLFCNITDVPTRVLTFPSGIGTDWYRPTEQPTAATEVRF